MTQGDVSQQQQAGLAKRLGAIFYDMLIVVSICFFFTIVWTAFGVTFGHPLYRLYVASLYFLIFIYFSWCWTHGGQTLGMKVWKIRLVRATHRFGWVGAMARAGIALISALAFGAGFWWALFDRNGLTWHDRLSNSRIVQVDL